jgi:hypothetical protein
MGNRFKPYRPAHEPGGSGRRRAAGRTARAFAARPFEAHAFAERAPVRRMNAGSSSLIGMLVPPFVTHRPDRLAGLCVRRIRWRMP